MAAKAALTIDVTASTAAAVADLDKAKAAVKGYGDAASTANTSSRDVAGAIDSTGSAAGQATAGLNDLGGALATMGGTMGTVGTAMQSSAIAMEALDGAATLYGVTQKALTTVVGIFDGVMKALKLTILTNPIFIIAAIIIAIGAAFVLAYTKCEWFRNIVDAAVRAVWNTIQTVYNWIKDNWPLLLTILGGPFGLAVALIIKHRDSIWNAIKAVYTWIRDTWDQIGDWLTAPFKAAWDVLKGIFDKIKGAIDTVINLISKIKFPKLPSWLPGDWGQKSAPAMAAAGFTAPGVARAPAAMARTGGGSGHIVLNVNVNPLSGNPYILGRQIARTVNRATFIDGPITGKI